MNVKWFKEFQRKPYTGQGVDHLPGTPILDVSNITVRFNTGIALDNLNFHLHTGEYIAVVGPNGAGKSTLFKVIAGIVQPTSGKINIYGHRPGGHTCIAYVPQRSEVDWTFPVSVADVVMMGRINKIGLVRWPSKNDWDYIYKALEDVGLQKFASRQISELSGGQQQRMFIARALAQEAELMLMDEPLSGLDLRSQESILQILDALQTKGVTIMVATHDLEQAASRFHRILLLNHRIIRMGTSNQVFTPEHLVAAYGGHLQLVETGDTVMAVTDTCCDDGESI